MMRALTMAAALGIAAAAAPATLHEVEPNDSIASAQIIPVIPQCFSEAVNGGLVPGDVDFYQIELFGGILFIASLFDFTPQLVDNDAILALFDDGGAMIAFGSDGGTGVLSVLFLIVPHSGTYYVGVSGVGDNGFIGDHEQLFPYKLVVSSCVPAPGALAALLFACCCGRSRRRR